LTYSIRPILPARTTFGRPTFTGRARHDDAVRRVEQGVKPGFERVDAVLVQDRCGRRRR
jgi:hypothetical protein